MDWKTCISDGNSIEITKNQKRAEFLLKRAESTLKVIEKIRLDGDNVLVFFANYYDSLLELLHAIMYAKGYKVRNHICLGYYIRDILKDEESFRVFDRARMLRNSIIYYGDNFDKDVAIGVIEDIKRTFNKLKKNAK